MSWDISYIDKWRLPRCMRAYLKPKGGKVVNEMGGRGAVCAKSLFPLFSTRLSPLRRISHLAVRMASPDPPAPPPSSSSAVDFLSLCHRLKVSSPLGRSFLSWTWRSLNALGVSARCSSDHEESRMGAARRARAGVGGRPHVPDGHHVTRVPGHSRGRSR